MRLIPPTTAKLVDHYRRVRAESDARAAETGRVARPALTLVPTSPGRAPDPVPRLPGWSPRTLLRLPAHTADAYAALRHRAALDPDAVALLAQRLLADGVSDPDLDDARPSDVVPTVEWLQRGARTGRPLGLEHAATTVTPCRLRDGRRCVLADLDTVGARELVALAALVEAGIGVALDGMSAAAPGLNVRAKLTGPS